MHSRKLFVREIGELVQTPLERGGLHWRARVAAVAALWTHERTPIPRNLDDLETSELADVLVTIAEDQQTRCAHDRGVSSSILIKNGVMIRLAGMEMPEQNNRAGRRGDMSKKIMSKATKDTRFRQRIEGHDSLRMLVKLPSKGIRFLRSMGSRRTSQTCCIGNGPRPWLDRTKLVAEFCAAENHEQVNTERDGMADQD